MNRYDSSATYRGVLILIGLMLLTGFGGSGIAQPVSAQGQVVSVGIINFQDESGTSAPTELGQKIAKDLQQRLVTFSDLLPRSVGSGMDSSALKAMTVEQLTALGKQQGVKYILRGGLLALTAEKAGEETKITVRLYAEIISVETGGVTSVRAEGVSTQPGASFGTGIKWNAISLTDSQFPNSALGQALASSIQQLAAAVHPAVTSPAASEQSQPSSEAIQAENAAAADSDEELQQLVAQAEALLSSGAAGTESLNALKQVLEGLRTALSTKASLLEQAQNTAPADTEIAARKQELQSAVSSMTQEVASAEASGTEAQQPSGEKKNLLSGINQYLGEALSILQKIQEMRATFRGAGEDPSYAGGDPAAYPEGEQGAPVEETTEEISGVITDEGEAVEGVVVTEEESGMSATTDANGSYFLQGIPAGRLATLVLTKSGKKVASSQVDLLRGRPALADFELKPKAGATSTSPLRIIPSTVLVKSAKAQGGGMGMLKGSVRDAQGRPVPRALITLKNLAAARTDSRGSYTFLNVPAGAHQLTVYKSGVRLKSERVEITTKKTRELKTAFVPGDKVSKGMSRQPIVLRGVGTTFRGVIVDQEKHTLPGARVTLLAHPSGVIYVLAGLKGNYEIRDLKPGSYRVLVAKVGYETSAQNISLNAGAPQSRDFQLKRSRSSLVEMLLAKQRARQREVRNQVRPPIIRTQPRDEEKKSPKYPNDGRATPGGTQRLPIITRSGQVRGRVTDTKSGSPVAGAVVSVPGRPGVMTNREGVYLIVDLAPGTYRVVVRRKDFTDGGGTMNVRSGETVLKDFKVTPKPTPLIRLKKPQ